MTFVPHRKVMLRNRRGATDELPVPAEINVEAMSFDDWCTFVATHRWPAVRARLTDEQFALLFKRDWIEFLPAPGRARRIPQVFT